MAYTITIDARMIKSGGIGVYIKNMLPIIINSLTDIYFNILGDKNDLSNYQFLDNGKVCLIDFISPIYSIKEQIKLI